MLDALVTEARLRFGLDPADGLQVIAAERLVATPLEASRPVLIVPVAMLRPNPPNQPNGPGGDAVVPPLPGRHGPRGRDPLSVLARLYPGEHPVGRFGTASSTTVAALTDADLAAPCYLAPLAPEAAVAGPWAMPAISDRLRASDGCPWDREQTHQSLRKHLLEEAYEVYDALEAGATPALAGELGDLLLQVVLHAQLAAEEGVFDLADVQAATLGYDWPTLEGVLDKVVEEANELREAAATDDIGAWAEEFGDLLFVLVNVARKRGVEAEAAMRAGNAKFRRRFGSVERQAAAQGVALRDLDFPALDALWDTAKAEERTTP